MDEAPSRNVIRKPAFLIGVFYLIFLLLFAFSFSELPARVASHFSFNGTPDGWMSRSDFLRSALLVAVFLPPLPAIAFYALRWLPSRSLRLPLGWMSPERRDTTLHELLIFGLWLSFMLLVLQIALLGLVLIANQKSPAHIPEWLTKAPFYLFVVMFVPWIVRITQHFHKSPNQESM